MCVWFFVCFCFYKRCSLLDNSRRVNPNKQVEHCWLNLVEVRKEMQQSGVQLSETGRCFTAEIEGTEVLRELETL